MQTRRVLSERHPPLRPSGETLKQTFEKREEPECSVMTFQVERCHAKEIPSTQRAPSIALAKGTDILMEITSFWPLPGTVNTIAGC